MQQQLILNNQSNTVYDVLYEHFKDCRSFYLNVAFITFEALQLFVERLNNLNKLNIKGKVITSTYLNFNDPKAFKTLNKWDNIDLKVYQGDKGFHSKCYIFEYDDHYKVMIGSANLTASALKSNIEWNVEVISKKR